MMLMAQRRASFEIGEGLGGKLTTLVLRSQDRYSLEQLTSTIACSHIDRRKRGRVSLFMCHVSLNCPCKELLLYREATRVDIDLKSEEIRVWLLTYHPTKPDVVIKNSVVSSPAQK